MNSSPPKLSGLLESLFAEPQTLAALAVACRLCNHPDNGSAVETTTPTGELVTLHLCVMCGANALTERGEVPLASDWRGTVIAQSIGQDRLVEYEHTMLSLTEITHCLNDVRRRAVGAQKNELDEIYRALRDLSETPTVKAGERIAAATAALR